MKNILYYAIVLSCLVLTGCENPIRMMTRVGADGSLSKTIVLEKCDSVQAASNIFGVGQTTGWTTTLTSLDTINQTKKVNDDKSYRIEFRKNFSSAEVANLELDRPIDTLFQIESSFEKKFRWFYTYIRYSETFRPLNRFKHTNLEDYFTPEDKAFLNRLPGEGQAITKADSLFYQTLSDKIYEKYTTDALNEEIYRVLADVIQQNNMDKKWLDTLRANRLTINKQLDEGDGEFPAFLTEVLHQLNIPVKETQTELILKQLSKDLKSRIDFMTFASDGKYLNVIEMPGGITASNADSVAGSFAFYRPLSMKFTIQPYTQFAETRHLNVWAIIVSGVIILLTAILWIRSKNR